MVESLVNLKNQNVAIEYNGGSYDLMQLILNHDASQFKATQPRTLENKILCKSLVHFHPDRSSTSNRATNEDQNEITSFITDLTSEQPNQKTLDKFKVLQRILRFIQNNGEAACLSTRPAPSAAIVPAFCRALATGMSAQQLEKDLTDRFIKAIEKHLQKEAVLLGKFHKHLNIVQQQIKQDLMYTTAALLDVAPVVRLNHVSNKFRDMLKGYLVTKTLRERINFQGNIDTLAATYGQILRANDTIQKARTGQRVVVVSREHGAEIVAQGGASIVANTVYDTTSTTNIGKDNQEARNIISKRAFNC